MIAYSALDAEKAKKYSINPYGLLGILRVFDRLGSFADVSIADIEHLITEESYVYSLSKPPKYTYRNLPIGLQSLLADLIRKYGAVGNFLNLPDAEHRFILGFIKKRLQPRDLMFTGRVCWDHEKRGEYEDHTYQVADYHD